MTRSVADHGERRADAQRAVDRVSPPLPARDRGLWRGRGLRPPLARERTPHLNEGLEDRRMLSGGIPIPVSRHRNIQLVRRCRAPIVTVPPGAVNLTAFGTGLEDCSTSRDLPTPRDRAARPELEAHPFIAPVAHHLITVSMASRTGTSPNSYESCPASMRLKLRMSLMMPNRCC